MHEKKGKKNYILLFLCYNLFVHFNINWQINWKYLFFCNLFILVFLVFWGYRASKSIVSVEMYLWYFLKVRQNALKRASTALQPSHVPRSYLYLIILIFIELFTCHMLLFIWYKNWGKKWNFILFVVSLLHNCELSNYF